MSSEYWASILITKNIEQPSTEW